MKKILLMVAFGTFLSSNVNADEWVFPVGNPDVEPSSSGTGNANDSFGGWEYTQHHLNNGGDHYGTDMDYTIGEGTVQDAHKMVRTVSRGRVIYSGYTRGCCRFTWVTIKKHTREPQPLQNCASTCHIA